MTAVCIGHVWQPIPGISVIPVLSTVIPVDHISQDLAAALGSAS